MLAYCVVLENIVKGRVAVVIIKEWHLVLRVLQACDVWVITDVK